MLKNILRKLHDYEIIAAEYRPYTAFFLIKKWKWWRSKHLWVICEWSSPMLLNKRLHTVGQDRLPMKIENRILVNVNLHTREYFNRWKS